MNARVRGLETHLLTPEQMRQLAGTTGLTALGEGLRSAGVSVEERIEPSPEALELAVRRRGATQLRLLIRWCGPRSATLAAVFEDAERRALRAIVRGAVQGAPPAQRLAGTLPMPSLPEKALGELARQPTALKVAALLTAWRHPYGRPLLPYAASPQPDLLRMETALNRTFATRALRAAGRSVAVRTFVHELLDMENARTALALAGSGRQLVAREFFLRGGDTVTRDGFERAVASGSASAAAESLAALIAPPPLAAALRAHGARPAELEPAIDHAHIAILTERRRREPLDATTVLLFAVRVRTELVDLRRIIWGLALGAPAGARLATATH